MTTKDNTSTKLASEVYSDKQIKAWLDEDKLDPLTAAKLKTLITPAPPSPPKNKSAD